MADFQIFKKKGATAGSIFMNERLLKVVCIVPLLLFLLIVWFIPIMYGLYGSFLEDPIYNPIFVGADNYITLLTEDFFTSDLVNSIIYAVSTTFLSLVIGLAIALALNQGVKFQGFLSTLMISTYLIPVIATVMIWRFLFDRNLGVVNQVLVDIGMVSEPIAFVGEPKWAMPALIITSIWKYAPFAFFIILARLQSIDPDIYQRARVQGASKWQAFRDITLPQLRSAILLVILVRGIFMFNKFDLIWLLTRGGPLETTTTFPVRIYRLAFSIRDFGLASALAAVLFVLLIITAQIYFRKFNPSEKVEGS